jgi:hypothetical protein
MGQSNIAAGATIGSNHNSRSPDGEIVAGRGFWPGLCVSLKHNSKFASFTILAKGDYPAELNIPVPFSLISNDVANDKLVIMPGYWFMYNMYALERNSWKYADRDRRTDKIQYLEYDYLAPDTINELFDSIQLLTALQPNEEGIAITSGWENTSRETEIVKVPQSIDLFIELIRYYGTIQLLQHFLKNKFANFDNFKKTLSAKIQRSQWHSIGGQLMQQSEIETLKRNIKTNKIEGWGEVHDFYIAQGEKYYDDKLHHAYTSLLEILLITPRQFTADFFIQLLQEALATRTWMCKGIYESRAKDYSNPFRKLVYETHEEMNKVLGSLEDNSFIQQQTGELETLKKQVKSVTKKLKL